MTFDPLSRVRPEVRRLKAYHLDLTPAVHKLDQNEVPYELPPPVKRRVAEILVRRPWRRYPDFHSDALRTAIGKRLDWPMEGVLAGSGSGELIEAALATFVSPGGEVLGTRPSFSLYGMLLARVSARPVLFAAGDDLRLPLDDVRRAVDEDPTRPLLLCSPNNPTGDAASVEDVDDLLSRLEAPLFLDHAYGEFADVDYRPLLDKHRHLLVFHTFSKAWSLAGLRLGYLLADPAVAEEIAKVKRPYNVNFLTAAAGEALLADSAAAERRVRVLVGRRAQWAAMLAEAGLRVYPSQANFVLARHPKAPEIGRALDRRGIRIRVLGGHEILRQCLRFSVGTGVALRATRTALEEIMENIV
jgi:histidinol-phosphate aminotransferase